MILITFHSDLMKCDRCGSDKDVNDLWLINETQEMVCDECRPEPIEIIDFPSLLETPVGCPHCGKSLSDVITAKHRGYMVYYLSLDEEGVGLEGGDEEFHSDADDPIYCCWYCEEPLTRDQEKIIKILRRNRGDEDER